MKRWVPLRQGHRPPPVYRLRVHWGPLCPSSLRLGAFALRPHPGVPSLPVRRLLGPLRLFVRALACRWGLPGLLATRLHLPYEVSRVQPGRRKQHEPGGGLLSLPLPLFAAPPSVDSGEHRLTSVTFAPVSGRHWSVLSPLVYDFRLD
jgi:hypothetical protein